MTGSGYREVSTCAHCGQATEPDARFCRFCGKPLSSSAGVALPRQEFTISVPVDILNSEMVVTAIAWYMAASAILSLLFFPGALLVAGVQQMVSELRSPLPSGLQQGAVLWTILGYLSFFWGVLAGTAATGLFRLRRWALELTKGVLIVAAVLGLIFLLLQPAWPTVLHALVTVGIAVAVWIYFSRPDIRSHFPS